MRMQVNVKILKLWNVMRSDAHFFIMSGIGGG